MGKLIIDQSKVTQETGEKLVSICPFGAIEFDGKKLDINSACKMCRMCVRKGPQGVVTYQEDEVKVPQINKEEWKGICVFVELTQEGVHPVVFELIGKAKELASVTNDKVIAVIIASDEQINKYKDELLSYGLDKLYAYGDSSYEKFNVELASRCMVDFVNKYKPSVILYGGTPLGRSFAPKIANTFKTGLTADCTRLGMKENSDLIQVRPAFGGNVMAQIICTNTRPQMATVRYKIFKKPEQVKPYGEFIYNDTKDISKETSIKILDIIKKEKSVDISEADIVIACGRAFKSAEELELAEELANELGGVVATTRPLIEAGFRDPKFQIGLSGKTVAPKLIITLGVSGAVQFVAGMSGSETIISINLDPNAEIFEISHYGIVGDVFKIVPELIKMIKAEKGR